MALLARTKRSAVTGQKFNPAYKALLMPGMRTPVWTATNIEALTREGYTQNVDVFACVDLISKCFGGLPWVVKRKRRTGDPEILKEHALIDLINRPNPMQGRGAFFTAVAAYQEISGNTYIFRFSPRQNQPPRELWPLRPDRMQIIQSNDPADPIARFEYTCSQLVKFEPDRRGHTVMHWKSFHPLDDWYGLSAIQVAARAVDQSNAASSWNTSMFQNQCRPSGVLQVGKDGAVLSKEQFDRITDTLKREYIGATNAGMPMILEGGMEWQQISLTPLEMDWLGGDAATTDKICEVYHVPPELLGRRGKGGLNDSNYIQARRQFYTEKLLPEADLFRDEFNNSVTPCFDDDSIFLDYDRDEIEAIQEDRTIVHQRAIEGVKGSCLMIDEGRQKMGDPPLPDGLGQVYLIPAGVIPVGPGAEKVLKYMQMAQPADPNADPEAESNSGPPARKPAPDKPAPVKKPKQPNGEEPNAKELFDELSTKLMNLNLTGRLLG